MTTHAASPSRPRFHIPSLDGVRGGAFLLVFFGHALPAHMLRFVPPAFGVTVFFVLSGYLITTLLRNEFDESNTVSLRDFYLRRALRILPPFYIVLIAASVLTQAHALDGKVTAEGLVAYALHCANYWHIFRGLDEIPGGTSVYWSLSVEEHFYLLFPVIYWGMRRYRLSSRQQLAVLLGLCGAVLLWRTVLVTVLHAPDDRLYRGSDTRVDAILFGCALAVYGNPVLDPTRFSPKVWRGVWLPLGALALAFTSLVRDHVFQGAIKGSIQAIALIPFFVVAVRFPSWGPMRFLNTRAARFIGLISYSLYLTHRAVLMLVETWVTSNIVLQIAIALPTTIALCYGLYVFVEEPCARLRKRLSSRDASKQEQKGTGTISRPVWRTPSVPSTGSNFVTPGLPR